MGCAVSTHLNQPTTNHDNTVGGDIKNHGHFFLPTVALISPDPQTSNKHVELQRHQNSDTSLTNEENGRQQTAPQKNENEIFQPEQLHQPHSKDDSDDRQRGTRECKVAALRNSVARTQHSGEEEDSKQNNGNGDCRATMLKKSPHRNGNTGDLPSGKEVVSVGGVPPSSLLSPLTLSSADCERTAAGAAITFATPPTTIRAITLTLTSTTKSGKNNSNNSGGGHHDGEQCCGDGFMSSSSFKTTRSTASSCVCGGGIAGIRTIMGVPRSSKSSSNFSPREENNDSAEEYYPEKGENQNQHSTHKNVDDSQGHRSVDGGLRLFAPLIVESEAKNSKEGDGKAGREGHLTTTTETTATSPLRASRLLMEEDEPSALIPNPLAITTINVNGTFSASSVPLPPLSESPKSHKKMTMEEHGGGVSQDVAAGWGGGARSEGSLLSGASSATSLRYERAAAVINHPHHHSYNSNDDHDGNGAIVVSSSTASSLPPQQLLWRGGRKQEQAANPLTEEEEYLLHHNNTNHMTRVGKSDGSAKSTSLATTSESGDNNHSNHSSKSRNSIDFDDGGVGGGEMLSSPPKLPHRLRIAPHVQIRRQKAQQHQQASGGEGGGWGKCDDHCLCDSNQERPLPVFRHPLLGGAPTLVGIGTSVCSPPLPCCRESDDDKINHNNTNHNSCFTACCRRRDNKPTAAAEQQLREEAGGEEVKQQTTELRSFRDRSDVEGEHTSHKNDETASVATLHWLGVTLNGRGEGAEGGGNANGGPPTLCSDACLAGAAAARRKSLNSNSTPRFAAAGSGGEGKWRMCRTQPTEHQTTTSTATTSRSGHNIMDTNATHVTNCSNLPKPAFNSNPSARNSSLSASSQNHDHQQFRGITRSSDKALVREEGERNSTNSYSSASPASPSTITESVGGATAAIAANNVGFVDWLGFSQLSTGAGPVSVGSGGRSGGGVALLKGSYVAGHDDDATLVRGSTNTTTATSNTDTPASVYDASSTSPHHNDYDPNNNNNSLNNNNNPSSSSSPRTQAQLSSSNNYHFGQTTLDHDQHQHPHHHHHPHFCQQQQLSGSNHMFVFGANSPSAGNINTTKTSHPNTQHIPSPRQQQHSPLSSAVRTASLTSSSGRHGANTGGHYQQHNIHDGRMAHRLSIPRVSILSGSSFGMGIFDGANNNNTTNSSQHHPINSGVAAPISTSTVCPLAALTAITNGFSSCLTSKNNHHPRGIDSGSDVVASLPSSTVAPPPRDQQNSSHAHEEVDHFFESTYMSNTAAFPLSGSEGTKTGEEESFENINDTASTTALNIQHRIAADARETRTAELMALYPDQPALVQRALLLSKQSHQSIGSSTTTAHEQTLSCNSIPKSDVGASVETHPEGTASPLRTVLSSPSEPSNKNEHNKNSEPNAAQPLSKAPKAGETTPDGSVNANPSHSTPLHAKDGRFVQTVKAGDKTAPSKAQQNHMKSNGNNDIHRNAADQSHQSRLLINNCILDAPWEAYGVTNVDSDDEDDDCSGEKDRFAMS